MRIELKILLAIAVIILMFYLSLNFLGIRLNISWFFGEHTVPLFEHKVF